jgi:hypothetical protein
MADDIPLAQAISIRDAGLDEYWLQDQIYENPACLGLGDLDAIAKERQQSSGGRLDILLKDAEDDTMYEVEIMLGETDESHIVRTIEYWDNERRRWPQRQHFAVLVAEHINRRFFNVIHLLSHSIPMIAIQASLIQVRSQRGLFFTKVLDTYEEVDDGTSVDDRNYNREYWAKRSKWTLEAADALLSIVSQTLPTASLGYLKHYVSITVGRSNYFWLHKRSGDKSLLVFRLPPNKHEEIASLLDSKNIPYIRKPKRFMLTVDKQIVEKEASLFTTIVSLVGRQPEGDG